MKKEEIESREQRDVGDDGAEQADDGHKIVEASTHGNGDVVKEALDLAQSVGAMRETRSLGGAFQMTTFDDSVSLSDYIEEAEKKSRLLFEPERQTQEPLEDLDILNIAAEFGRPDDTNEVPEEVAPEPLDVKGTESVSSEYPFEDTRDLTLKSRNPSSAILVGDVPGGERVSLEQRVDGRSDGRAPNVDARAATMPEGELPGETALGLPRGRAEFGELSEDSLVDLLVAVYGENRSGVLILKRNRTVCRIFVHDGDIIMAESTSRELGLAAWLLDLGYVDEETYTSLVRETSSLNTLQRGASIVSRGIVAPREMNRLLRQYYEHLVLSVSEWRNGSWRFEKSVKIRPGDTSVLIESPTPRLILEGYIRGASSEEVRSLVPVWSRLKKTGSGICKLVELGLDGAGRMIYDECEDSSDVWQRILQNPFEADRYHRFIGALVTLGFVAVIPGDTAMLSAGRERLSSAAALGSRAGSPSTASESQGMRTRVYEKMAVIQEGSYFDLLEIDAGAASDGVAAARQRLLEEFDLEAYSRYGVGDLGEALHLIRFIVEEAFQVLTHPKVGDAYRRSQADVDG